jgi:hypothetical protein
MLGHWYRLAPINECVLFVVHFVRGLNIVFTMSCTVIPVQLAIACVVIGMYVGGR